jgi:hypothetical protein
VVQERVPLNVNELAYPVFDYQRVDGRRLMTVRHLHFLDPHVISSEKGGDADLLVLGALFGVVVRYHWKISIPRGWRTAELRKEALRSRRVHLLAEFTGEYSVPSCDTEPTEQTAPLLQVSVYPNPSPDYHRAPIGTMAVSWLCENRRAGVASLDYDALARTVAFSSSCPSDHRGVTHEQAHLSPHLGKVQIGGLYHIPPLNLTQNLQPM